MFTHGYSAESKLASHLKLLIVQIHISLLGWRISLVAKYSLLSVYTSAAWKVKETYLKFAKQTDRRLVFIWKRAHSANKRSVRKCRG